MATRRDTLIGLAAGSASAVLARATPQHQPAEPHVHEDAIKTDKSTETRRTPQVFHGRDYETIAAVCELIIPRTDTPGAADVGVPWRIDQAVQRKPELKSLYENGLQYLNSAAKGHGAEDFLGASTQAQTAILTTISDGGVAEQHKFFQSIKGLTIEWYYNTQEGLAHELGFKGNTYRTDFIGCTHPEHWPEVEGDAHAGQNG
jgi:hypothetical protein